MSSMTTFCVLASAANLITASAENLIAVCVGLLPASPHAQAPVTGTGASPASGPANSPLTPTGSNANPSLLLSLLESFSSSSSGQSDPLLSGSSITGHSATESTQHSSSTVSKLPSNPSQSMLSRGSSTKAQSGRGRSPAVIPTLAHHLQYFMRDMALLNSDRHTPLRIALAKGETISAAEQAATANKLMKMIVLMASAKSLECNTVGEMVGGESMAYLPLRCRGRCPRGNTCKTIGPINFCCPSTVTNRQIQMNAIYGPISL